MNAELRTMQPRMVLTARHEGSRSTLPGAFERLFDYISRRHVGSVPEVLTIHNEDPVEAPFGRLRSEAAVALAAGHMPEAPGIGVKVLPGGTYAVSRYTGPYSGLMQAWAGFRAALGVLGVQRSSGPCFEVYLSDPETTPESELVTELYSRIRDGLEARS